MEKLKALAGSLAHPWLPRLLDKGRTGPWYFHLQLMGYPPVQWTPESQQPDAIAQ
jgi:hypothetical protein